MPRRVTPLTQLKIKAAAAQEKFYAQYNLAGAGDFGSALGGTIKEPGSRA